MRYSIRKLNSDAKRYVRPREFGAKLCGTGGSERHASISLTLHDPRTEAGEGLRMHLDFEPEDVNCPLMAAFIGRLCAMMSPETHQQLMLVFARESAATKIAIDPNTEAPLLCAECVRTHVLGQLRKPCGTPGCECWCNR